MAEGAVVVGASSGVGRAVAEELARRGWSLVVSARDRRDLEAVAADLSTRERAVVRALPVDLSDPGLDPERFARAAAQELGRVDLFVLTAGVVDEEDDGLAAPAPTERLVRVNYLAAIQLLAAFARLQREQGGGQIVAISSIAAAAPRRRNAVYSSAKAGLEVYARGLRHALYGTGVRIQVYALGYVDTRLAFGQRLLFPAASPEAVARQIVGALGSWEGVRYYPRFWSVVVKLFGLVPESLRLRFKY